jgi:hypothetical protein
VPNPNNGTFIIMGNVLNGTNSGDAGIEIVDLFGRVILNDAATIQNNEIRKNITLDDNVANGIYYVKIKAGSTIKVLKFTLNR